MEKVYDLLDEEKICTCGHKLHFIKNIETVKLKIIPEKHINVTEKQAVYDCRGCEKNNINTTIKTAKKPIDLFSGSIVSKELILKIIIDKFMQHVPLYRQEAKFFQDGLPISRQNQANWAVKTAEAFKPVYDALKVEIMKESFIHADETPFQVLKEPNRKATQKLYVWAYKANSDVKLVSYEYTETRAGENPRRFLEGYNGYLMTDALKQYDSLLNVKNLICMAHIRRKFMDAFILTGSKKGKCKR